QKQPRAWFAAGSSKTTNSLRVGLPQSRSNLVYFLSRRFRPRRTPGGLRRWTESSWASVLTDDHETRGANGKKFHKGEPGGQASLARFCRPDPGRRARLAPGSGPDGGEWKDGGQIRRVQTAPPRRQDQV